MVSFSILGTSSCLYPRMQTSRCQSAIPATPIFIDNIQVQSPSPTLVLRKLSLVSMSSCKFHLQLPSVFLTVYIFCLVHCTLGFPPINIYIDRYITFYECKAVYIVEGHLQCLIINYYIK
jgi:hypothetical protein